MRLGALKGLRLLRSGLLRSKTSSSCWMMPRADENRDLLHDLLHLGSKLLGFCATHAETTQKKHLQGFLDSASGHD